MIQPYTKCIVPWCRRTSGGKRPCAEYICGTHWKAVPRQQRAFLFRLRRKLKLGRNERTELQEWRAWQRCKRIAMAAAVERRALEHNLVIGWDPATDTDKCVIAEGMRDEAGNLHITKIRSTYDISKKTSYH